jgi:hypothetical protein
MRILIEILTPEPYLVLDHVISPDGRITCWGYLVTVGVQVYPNLGSVIRAMEISGFQK